MIKFCQICKNDNHNIDQCPSELVGGRCPTKEIVRVHVVQAKAPIIQKNKQRKYEISNNKKEYGN